MKTIRMYGIVSLMALSLLASGQDGGKKKLQDDFENYKKFREQDFEAFKKKREEELKKMEQEYQDYYNEMMGLKKYYVEKKDTAKENEVSDIIQFETKVSAALGKPLKVTEVIKVENPLVNQTIETSQKDEAKQSSDKEKQNKVSFQQAYNDKQKDEQQVQVTEKQNDEVKAKEEKQSQPIITNQPATSSETSDDLSMANLPTEERRALPVLTPVPKVKSKITSPFGLRNHPTLGRPMKHNGVDFGTGRGAEIYAAADGKVVLAELNRSYGNYIVIEHKDGHSSAYAHLQSISITKGSMVRKGQLLGYSGSTGRSSGPHLHYEVRINGTPVNPKDFLIETK